MRIGGHGFGRMRSKRYDVKVSDIPIECVRKIRSLNVDKSSRNVTKKIYKLMMSNNCRSLFSFGHRRVEA